MDTIKILMLTLISFLTFSSCSDDDEDMWVDIPTPK